MQTASEGSPCFSQAATKANLSYVCFSFGRHHFYRLFTEICPPQDSLALSFLGKTIRPIQEIATRTCLSPVGSSHWRDQDLLSL